MSKLKERPLMVYVATPISGDFEKNIQTAKQRCAFIYSLGHIPVAPYLEYIRFLDDNKPTERKDGIAMGLKVLEKCDHAIFFGKKITSGMCEELNHCLLHSIPFHISINNESVMDYLNGKSYKEYDNIEDVEKDFNTRIDCNAVDNDFNKCMPQHKLYTPTIVMQPLKSMKLK